MKLLIMLMISFLVACTVVVINGRENVVDVDKKFDRKVKIDVSDEG